MSAGRSSTKQGQRGRATLRRRLAETDEQLRVAREHRRALANSGDTAAMTAAVSTVNRLSSKASRLRAATRSY